MLTKIPKGLILESDPRVCQIGHPAPPWLVNYADLMTELTCFFVLLLAFSGPLNKKVVETGARIENGMLGQGTPGGITYTKEGFALVVFDREGEAALFESGESALTVEMRKVLDGLAPQLLPLLKENDLIVEGHADNTAIRSPEYPSNWELSTARAMEVVHYLVDRWDFPPQRLAALGYGEFRPQAPNDTRENRARNRRVVFVIKASSRKPGPNEAHGAEKPSPSDRNGARGGPSLGRGGLTWGRGPVDPSAHGPCVVGVGAGATASGGRHLGRPRTRMLRFESGPPAD